MFGLIFSIAAFIGFSLFLLWYLYHFDRGEKEKMPAILTAVGFGVLSVFLTLGGEEILGKFITNWANSGGPIVLVLMCLTLGIGLIEESTKFWPMAIYIKGKSYFNEITDGVFYFAITGMTFGLIEDIIYAFRAHNANLKAKVLLGHSSSDALVLIRIVVGGFFHAATTGIVGYYFARAKIRKESMVKTWIAFFSMVLMHALFDFGLMYYGLSRTEDGGSALGALLVVLVLMMVPILNLGLFLYYMRANEHDVELGLAYDPKTAAKLSQDGVQTMAVINQVKQAQVAAAPPPSQQ